MLHSCPDTSPCASVLRIQLAQLITSVGPSTAEQSDLHFCFLACHLLSLIFSYSIFWGSFSKSK